MQQTAQNRICCTILIFVGQVYFMLQSVNEESLKKLQEYLCTLQVGQQKVAPVSLVFYIRDTAAETKSSGNRALPPLFPTWLLRDTIRHCTYFTPKQCSNNHKASRK